MGWWGQFSSGGVEAVGSGWLELFLVMSSLLGCGEGGGVEDDPDDTLGMGQLGGDGDTGLDGGDVDEADLVVAGVGVERNLCSSSMDWLIKGMIFLK